MSEDKKTRPRKGAMWFQEMTDDYFDIEYENMFEGCSSNARNIESLIKHFITKISIFWMTKRLVSVSDNTHV